MAGFVCLQVPDNEQDIADIDLTADVSDLEKPHIFKVL